MQDKPKPIRSARSLDGFIQKPSAPLPVARRRVVSAHTNNQPTQDTAPRLSATQLSHYLRHNNSVKQIGGKPHPRMSPDVSTVQGRTPLRKNPVTPANIASMPTARHPHYRTPDDPTSPTESLHKEVTNDASEPPTAKEFQRLRSKKTKPKKIHKHPKLRRTLLSAGGVLGALVLIVGGFLGWKFFNNTGKVFGGNVISNIGALVNSSPLKGQETGRVNILLAGNSADDVGHDGAALTDSIMLISIDTNNKEAFMLSIPRDFWVNIPDVGYRKINEANYWGNESSFKEDGYPEGGMGLLEKTLETNLDIDINYYALINYGAFKDTVDAVGGITVTIESSDPRGLYDPTFQSWEGGALKLSNGEHKLDGNTALKLARARGHDGGYGYATSDFTRTENQRKMLLGLKEKALSAGTLSNPIKIANLMDSIGDNVKTDFKLNEITTLVGLGKEIKTIDSLSFQDDTVKLLANYTSPAGQSALIPSAGLGDYTDIIKFLKQKMSNDPVVQEGATVTILNGTKTDGLARSEKTKLEAKGLGVESIAGAISAYAKTTIIDVTNGSKPATKKYLASTYKNATITSEQLETVPSGVDFVIILGENFTTSTSTSQ